MKNIPRTKPGHQRSAFTLIELLVVIAIIAILASILFPVFGRARENARRSSCQSNMKQVGLGITQYTQDNDEKMPYWLYQIVPAPAAPAPVFMTWFGAIQPYMKSGEIGRCPSAFKFDPLKSTNGKNVYWPSYGLNYIYLNAAGCQTNAAKTDYAWNPINIARIAQPSAMVAFTEIKVKQSTTAGSYQLSPTADAPGVSSAGEPTECDYTDGGWGSGSYMDDGAGDLGPITYTGSVDARHFDGMNVAFVDGHVKWFTPGRLASGTDWRVGVKNSGVNITDLSQYLWDYR